jgi:alpha-1,3-mannosyltransferase
MIEGIMFMKIVFTTTVYLPHIGGIEVCIHEIAQYLIRGGHSVTVIVADTNCKKPEEEIIENENVIRLPAYEIANFFVLKNKRYFDIVDKIIKDADVVHVNVCKFLYDYLAKHKKDNGYKLICTSHGWIYHTNKNKFIKDLYFKNVVAKFAPLYDGIINVSFQDQNIAFSFGIDNTCVIENGVDLKKYSGIQPKEHFDNIFMYWGRVSSNKGILECLEKLSYYKEPLFFYIIGRCEDKEYMSTLKEFIDKNEMNEKVVFCGPLSNDAIKEKLIESDIVIMPSLHEGFGMTLVECLVSNRPIIANKIESYEHILNNVGATEYIFDFSDSKALISDKVRQLTTCPVIPQNVEQYSVETMIKKTIEVYGINK